MKPVELEIFLEDGLTPGLKKVGQTVKSFSSDSKRRLKEVNEQVKMQRDVITQLESRYKDLQKAAKNAAAGSAQASVLTQLAQVKKELDGEKSGLQKLLDIQNQLKIETENTGVSLRQQHKALREEIATLLLAYRSLTDEEKNTAQGRELLRHIDELTEKAGELNDAIVDVSQAVSNAGSDTRGFDQAAGGLQLVVDGFGLATAGASALGLSEADLMEVQTQLQTALVASNALTSMQANLQKQSALMQGINTVQTKAAAIAENIKTWATGRGIVATKAATVAQAAFNAVAKANPYILLAAAVFSVVGALLAFSKGSAELKKIEEERQKQAEKRKQQEEEYAQTVVESAGTQIASYLRMKREWEKLGDSLAKKKKFITDTKEEWRKLGKEINNVNDMEEIFHRHTKDMVSAIILRAELKAYETRIQQAADDMVSEVEANKKYRYNAVTPGIVATSGSANGNTFYNETQKLSAEERVAAKKYLTKERDSGGFGITEYIDAEGVRIINNMRKDAANQAALERQQAAKDKAEKTINGYVDTMKELSGKLESTMSKLPGIDVEPDDNPSKPSTSDNDGRLEAEAKTAADLQKLRWQNTQDEIKMMADGAEKRHRQIALDYEKEIVEVRKHQEELAKANKESGTDGLNTNGLTDEQQSAIDQASEIAKKKKEKSLEELHLVEIQYMEQYLKEYGTYQQKRAAVSEEYDRKIAEATDEWQKKILERQKGSELQRIEMEAIKQSVDWGSVFGNFGTMFRDQLEPTIAKLRAISQTEEFRNSDLEDQQVLYELISKLEEANTSWDSGIFKTLGDDLISYQTAMRNYISAQEDEREATKALAEAKKRLRVAEDSGDNKAIASAKADVNALTGKLNKASEDVRNFGADVQDASNSLQASTTRANNMFNTLVSGLAGLKSGSLQGVGESLMNLDKLFNNSGVTNAVGGALAKGMSKLLGNSAIGKSVAEALGNSGLVGSIISAVLSLLDILKDGIGVLVSSLIDTVLDAVAGIIKNWLNGSMLFQIGKSIVDGVAGIFDALSFGGFSSLIDTGNGKQVQETIDRLTERNTTLQTAIEDLTDEIKASKGSKSVAAYRDAYGYQREANINYLGIAQAQAGYHDSHHSWNYYWNGFTRDQIARLSHQIGRSWDGDIWNLSPEEMKMLRANVDMWNRIQETGKGDYGNRLTEKLDDYIDQAGKLEELTNQLYEGLTGLSFDSLYDSFIDELMDMEASAEDFADNITEYFMRAMLSNKIGELYADRLEKWWNDFGKRMEDGDLSEADRNALSGEYMSIVEEAMKLRDQLAAATGYTGDGGSGSSQSGKAGSFAAMSQDQGTKLEGLFTSVQMHVANIDVIVEDVAAKMSVVEGYLARIADSTDANAKSAEEIRKMIEKIVRDGIKTR